MRPTNLGFKSPREISQSPYYNPPVTAKGAKLTYPPPNKQRPKSNLGSRFREAYPQATNASVFLGPGRYKDDYKSISNTLNSKMRPKYKIEPLESGSYTYVGDTKIFDQAFLSPKDLRSVPRVAKTSIDLTSPKYGTLLSSNNNIAGTSNPSPVQKNVGNLDLESKLKASSHQRTVSLQTSGRRSKTPMARKTSTTVNHVFTEYTNPAFTENDANRFKKLTSSQKQRNNAIYNKILEAQLSPELKLIKKELELFQLRSSSRTTSKAQIISSMEELESEAKVETREEEEKEEEEQEEEEQQQQQKNAAEETGIREQDELEDVEPEFPSELSSKEKNLEHLNEECPRVLIDAPVNTQSFRTLQPSLFQNDTLPSCVSSPKFGMSQPETTKQVNLEFDKPPKKGNINNENKAKGKLLTQNVWGMSIPSYGIQDHKSGRNSKGVRMI